MAKNEKVCIHVLFKWCKSLHVLGAQTLLLSAHTLGGFKFSCASVCVHACMSHEGHVTQGTRQSDHRSHERSVTALSNSQGKKSKLSLMSRPAAFQVQKFAGQNEKVRIHVMINVLRAQLCCGKSTLLFHCLQRFILKNSCGQQSAGSCCVCRSSSSAGKREKRHLLHHLVPTDRGTHCGITTSNNFHRTCPHTRPVGEGPV